jgi:hypothetical protein
MGNLTMGWSQDGRTIDETDFLGVAGVSCFGSMLFRDVGETNVLVLFFPGIRCSNRN